MKKMPEQTYTLEFKELAIKRVTAGESIPAVAKAATAGKLNETSGKTVTPEAMELSRLRAEVARLKRETEILKKAAAYFVKDAR